MQKIILTPKELAAQLPELRLDILQLYDDNIILNGREVIAKEKPWKDNTKSIEERYPILKKYLSRRRNYWY